MAREGLTDFSLIEVVEKENQLGFQRMAVGNHLLLGGDNMDLAIAHYLEKKLPNMNDSHWPFLLYEARQAKEKLLSDPKAEICPITLLGTGSHVIQGSLATQIKKDELLPLLLHGFFGNYNFEEASQIKKSSGIRTMGLPFENEPSITKHLAAFLRQNQAEPDYVLFNGGTLKPKIFQEAITNSLHTWFKDKKTQMLSSFSLDLAVARGAAYYGKVRRGLGVKIGGGLPRSFYLEVAIKDAPNSALTIMPRGSEEGSSFTSQETFYLSPNTPVAFNLFSSHTRLHDEKGSIISLDPLEMQPLPAIHTVLRFGKTSEKIPVKLEVLLTAIGTLELWLSSLKTDHRWKLEFQIKSASGQENALTLLEKREADETFDSSFLEKAKKLILDSFSEKRFPKPEKLMEALEVALERPKQKWSPAILRGLFDPLLESVSKRKQTHAHEMRFWNLAGFLLRPGFGYPLDDFRIKEFWKIILAELQNPTREELWIQQLICYRRISGGLNKGQQMRIASEIFPKSGKMEIKGKKELYLYIEKIRTLASFELLDLPLKQKIGEMLLKKIAQDDGMVSECWALGRIGARRLFYGPFTHVIPKAICQSWIEKLLQSPHFDPEKLWLPIGQMARKTDHREINLEPSFLKIILEKFQGQSHYERLEKLLYHEESQYSLKEQEEIFGEELPMGLSLD